MINFENLNKVIRIAAAEYENNGRVVLITGDQECGQFAANEFERLTEATMVIAHVPDKFKDLTDEKFAVIVEEFDNWLKEFTEKTTVPTALCTK